MKLLALLALSIFTVDVAAVEPADQWPETVTGQPAMGAADFRPSPDRPIGYRGCQNGWFPGATPPLRFSDGAVTKASMKIRNKWNKVEETEVLTLADDQSVNIRYKTPLPGWSLSQPLPVLGSDGKLRVFVKCHPWWVACIDGESGEMLWKDQLTPFHAEGLAAAEADRRAEVMTLVWAASEMIPTLLGHDYHGFNKKRQTLPRSQHQDVYAATERALAAMIQRAQELEPDLVPHLEKIRPLFKQDLPQKGNEQVWRNFNGAFKGLRKAFTQKYPYAVLRVWFHGYTGLAMPAPVSDGDAVYVTFGQGQVACYTLSGKKKWQRLILPEKVMKRGGSSMYYSSPALIDNKLIFFPAPQQRSGIIALDAATGATAWHIEGGTPWAKNEYSLIRPVRTRGPDGKTLLGFIAARQKNYHLFGATDGKDYGILGPRSGYSAGPNYMNEMLICSEGGSDSGKHHAWARTWQWSDEGTIASSDAYPLGKLVKSYPMAVSPAAIIDVRSKEGGIISTHTGKRLAGLPRGESPTIAGKYVIIPQDQSGTSYNPRGRADGWATRNFTIVDISDPAKPRTVSNNNLLVSKHLPADLTFDRHMAPHGVDKRYCTGDYRTILAHFGNTNCGVVPHGEMLFVQSATDLYGIGE